ncbi:MAG: hypothetical protein ACREP7_00260 [Lysobacter sp.]
MKQTLAFKNAALGEIKTLLDGGALHMFAGPVPATADEALDMATNHTALNAITNNGGGTGLTFDTPTTGVLTKAAAETWKGTNTFEGADQAETTLQPTFYRFCAAGDNGRAVANASTGYRLQGTIGGPSSAAELRLGTTTITAGNEQPVGDFVYRLAQA